MCMLGIVYRQIDPVKLFPSAACVGRFVANDPDRPAGWAHEAGLLTEVVVSGAGNGQRLVLEAVAVVQR